MAKFDRYLLSQLLALFGFFSLVLVSVYWINRAVGLFDRLIGDGQSALVFLEFSLLTLPNVIRLVLPVSAFAATVYAINRLTQDSELTVMQATGVSPVRLARPVVWFGLIVAAMMLILLHVLVPASRTILAERQAEVSGDLSAKFLTEGQFLHPTRGVTLFIRAISEDGELQDLFLVDGRGRGDTTTYTARRAFLVIDDAATPEAGAKLVMIDGVAQALDRATGRLSVTRYADFTYDISGFLNDQREGRRDLDQLSTVELLFPPRALVAELGESRAAFLFEGHSRIAQPFLALAGALLGFAALVLGSFSRFGLWRQIGLAVFLLIVMQLVNTAAAAGGMRAAALWPLAYAAPLTGIAIAAVLIWLAARPRHLRRPLAGMRGAAT